MQGTSYRTAHERRRTAAIDMERCVVANRRSTSFNSSRSSEIEVVEDEDVVVQHSTYLRMIADLRRSNLEFSQSNSLAMSEHRPISRGWGVESDSESFMDMPSEISGSSSEEDDDEWDHQAGPLEDAHFT